MDIISGTRGTFRTFTLSGQFWRQEDMCMLEEHVGICISSRHPQVVLNLEGLSFVSSQGLGLLVRLHTRCRDEGGRLVLFQPRSSVHDVIEISDLRQFMAVADTAEELDKLCGIEGNGGADGSTVT